MATDVACLQAEKGQDIPLLTFGSDRPLRRRFFVPEAFLHPAKLHLGLLSYLIDHYTRPGEVIADPMCGTGSLLLAATMQREVIVRDVEPRWVAIARANAAYLRKSGGLFLGTMDVGQQDARLPWGYQANHVICSPPYGCEMSASPHAQKTLPYRLSRLPQHHDRWDRFLGAPNGATAAMLAFHYGTSVGQIGGFRGRRYWRAMHAVYKQAHEALRPGGQLILILKDHIKDGQRVPTAQMTIVLCQQIGFHLAERFQRLVHPLSLWQRRRREQGLPVVEEEDVLIFRKEGVESYDQQ